MIYMYTRIYMYVYRVNPSFIFLRFLGRRRAFTTLRPALLSSAQLAPHHGERAPPSGICPAAEPPSGIDLEVNPKPPSGIAPSGIFRPRRGRVHLQPRRRRYFGSRRYFRRGGRFHFGVWGYFGSRRYFLRGGGFYFGGRGYFGRGYFGPAA